jgi:hypothetical protein
MASQPTSQTCLQAAEKALRKLQAQVAALEGLSEELSLSVHALELELTALRERPSLPTEASGRSNDVDGARLVALNMALAGDPREDAKRYLAEHFDIADRERLLDEVYAAAGR